MKQFDFETSNYKNKEEIKTFITTFNDMVDKYVKSFDNSDADLKKVNVNIEKKTALVGKLETAVLDLNKKVEELSSLKELANAEIKELTSKKSEITFTDSEVQKMELDDINSQITSKKSKIAKIEAKIEATKTKIKTNNDEKKTTEKELKELEKSKKSEEEALYRTQGILDLLKASKEDINSKVIEIINAPYRPVSEETKEESVQVEPAPEMVVKVPMIEDIVEEELNIKTDEKPEITESPAIDFDEPDRVEVEEEPIIIEEEPVEEEQTEAEDAIKEEVSLDYVEIDNIFKEENLSLDDFVTSTKEKILENAELVINNLEILKRHNVPLEYTIDQSEILYGISSQDLDDLLSIITTDDEGNGMGFTIDFTFNILKELSKVDVDKLIDVYNSEFMNVNAKSGIIHLLKLANPKIGEFDKNRRTNVEVLKSLGAQKIDEIAKKYPEFIDLDNPLFVNILNVFDKSDLVEKLNTDIDVIPKILDYWKNN